MSDYTAKKIDEMEAAFLGGFKRARAELGVESFGLQVLDLPPSFAHYPAHDHAEDGQEEVYIALRGSGAIEIDGERVELDPDTFVRVGPGAKRKVVTGDDSLRLLVIGGTPGKAYEAPDVTKLGQPDPLAA